MTTICTIGPCTPCNASRETDDLKCVAGETMCQQTTPTSPLGENAASIEQPQRERERRCERRTTFAPLHALQHSFFHVGVMSGGWSHLFDTVKNAALTTVGIWATSCRHLLSRCSRKLVWGLQHRKTRGPLFCSGFSTVTLNGGVILGHFAEYFLVGEDVFLSVVSILQCTMGHRQAFLAHFHVKLLNSRKIFRRFSTILTLRVKRNDASRYLWPF